MYFELRGVITPVAVECLSSVVLFLVRVNEEHGEPSVKLQMRLQNGKMNIELSLETTCPHFTSNFSTVVAIRRSDSLCHDFSIAAGEHKKYFVLRRHLEYFTIFSLRICLFKC